MTEFLIEMRNWLEHVIAVVIVGVVVVVIGFLAWTSVNWAWTRFDWVGGSVAIVLWVGVISASLRGLSDLADYYQIEIDEWEKRRL